MLIATSPWRRRIDRRCLSVSYKSLIFPSLRSSYHIRDINGLALPKTTSGTQGVQEHHEQRSQGRAGGRTPPPPSIDRVVSGRNVHYAKKEMSDRALWHKCGGSKFSMEEIQSPFL